MTYPTDTYTRITNGNGEGRDFNVRLVVKGERYGRDRCLVHSIEKPMVDVYDATYEGDQRFDPLGQFVSRYFVNDFDNPGALWMHGGVHAWRLADEARAWVVQWVRRALAQPTEILDVPVDRGFIMAHIELAETCKALADLSAPRNKDDVTDEYDGLLDDLRHLVARCGSTHTHAKKED